MGAGLRTIYPRIRYLPRHGKNDRTSEESRNSMRDNAPDDANKNHKRRRC